MRLLVTGALKKDDAFFKHIESLGHSICFMQYENDNLPCEYDWAEGVICNGLFLSHPIEKFTNLRFIQLTSAGFDRVDLYYINSHKIEIHNARGVYSVPIAEFALCGVLQLYKQSAFFRANQKQHIWEKHRGLQELSGKRVLIIGCGSVGNECAKRFAAFGCRVIGVDISPRQDNLYSEMLPLEKLDSELANADVAVLTLPLTEQTQHLMNNERFALMKDGAVLVNIARGAVVDTAALIKNINRLGGAVLDVFETEPLDESSPLWDKENVIITPHNSFVGEGNYDRLKDAITIYL